MRVDKLVKYFSKNESGMAIIMVTTAVAILTLVLTEFTFETKLNKIRVENQVDRYQAKLNAEAGLKFALAKLRIYKEAWNTLEDNDSLKETVSPSDAESVVTQPFVYPIPLPPSANIIQKTALEDFEKENLLRGELVISMSPVTGFLNPNSLKVIKKDNTSNQDQNQDQDQDQDDENQSNLSPEAFMEKTFTETFQEIFKEKIENDEDFAIKYSNINIDLLVKELKYYVNNPKDYDEPEKADIEKIYSQADRKPKHAALESIDELYSLEGWDDTIVNLIKDRLSVHQVSVININEITQNQLKTFFPALTDFQLESFFKRRDGDTETETDPKPFKDEAEFKKYLTEELGAVEASDYDKRVAEFKKSSITLGVAGKLFKVISKGTFGRSHYQLTAFIDLPVKPEIKKPETSKGNQNKPQTEKDNEGEVDPDQDNDQDNDQNQNQDQNQDGDKKKSKTYLLSPRIVEIRNY